MRRPAMFLRLPTVRAKLTALVSLSVLVMVAALPVLSWILHRQLVDEVDVRVSGAQAAFRTELDDDIADIRLASRVLGGDEGTRRAIEQHDGAGARRLAQTFLDIYPSIDVLLVDRDGRVLSQVGCEHPPERIGGVPGLAGLLRGKPVEGVIEHGCESPSSQAPPGYAIGIPMPGGGGAVVCEPLDRDYLKNASAKLGLELAFVMRPTATGARWVDATPGFPVDAAGVTLRAGTTLIGSGSGAWAARRFDPPVLKGPQLASMGVIAALDVTDIQALVRRNLLRALAVLAAAAAVSVWLGARLAGVMSRALRRVSLALERVQQLDYVHVEAVRTGDEIEQLATGFNAMVDGLKERDQLRTTFGKYMTATVMNHLLAGRVSLGGESLTATILFTDIRGFTTLSEAMAPQALVSLLNEYFSEMVGIVMQEDGVVDKYIGDAIMAVFGAPVSKPDDAVRAVRAAVRMRRALEALNVRLRARGMAALRTGIGIHTGEVIAGNIGSESRMEYTVIGDAVNLASRLETSTKDLGVDVLISEDTYERTRHVIESRPVKEITVKGRKAAVMTYEVLGLRDAPKLDGEAG